jgi:hypothetical protein
MITLRPPITILASGPLEVIIQGGQLRINSTSGPIIHIFGASHLVFHYPDYGETEIYGDTTEPRRQ